MVERGHPLAAPADVSLARHPLGAPNEPLLRFPWARYATALRRYKWLVLLVIVLGLAAGYGATKLLAPVYEVHASVWISTDTQNQERSGPIRAVAPMRETSWPELLTSFAILEQVAREKALFLQPTEPADSVLFAGFAVEERFRPGRYELVLDRSGWRYDLRTPDGPSLQSGTLGDSIGRRLGFLWKPPANALTPGSTVEFTLLTPREAAIALKRNLTVSFSSESNLLGVVLKGNDPQKITAVMSTLVDEFIAAAAALKRRNVSEVAKALKGQLDYAERELRDAEAALESFRVRTIALPSESSPTAGGEERESNPVFQAYFGRQVEFDNTRRDRQALETTLAAIQAGQLDASALWSVPAIGSNAPPDLRAALAELSTKQTALREAQRVYTDDHPNVRSLRQEVAELNGGTIPRLTSGVIAELQRRERDLASQLEGTARDLRAIPVRTTEETRLRRNVEARGTLFETLKARHEEATLAEASTVPDVSVLDLPVAPEQPSQSRAPYVLAFAGLVSIALALALVFVLDRFDPRFRYVEQATDELGLDIIGAVPALRETSPELRDHDEASVLLESFRTIRLNLANAFHSSGPPVMFTVSSPGIGDGKSLVSSELGLSFASGGFRTLLVDGDLRRGGLHSAFRVDRRPGLVELLAGDARLEDVLRRTNHDNLTVIPRGVINERAPEMLMSPAMSRFIDDVRARYDAIIIDSPPLGAGIDPYVIGTATGNLLLVLRSGETDRKMAEAKLGLLRRLPIRLLGVVLNDSNEERSYQYYAYVQSDLPGDLATAPRFDKRITELAEDPRAPRAR